MSLENIIEDSYGQLFEVTITQDGTAANISAYNVAQTFLLKNPSGGVSEIDGAFSTDGSDGKVSFTVAEGTFTNPGTWKVQVYLESSSAVIRTDWKAFTVKDSLNS